MKLFRALTFGVMLLSPVLGYADDRAASPPVAAPAPVTFDGVKDAKLVPLMRDDVFVGFKVFAIRAGGRFDQAQAPYKAGDVIEAVDDVPVTGEAGKRALLHKVVQGEAAATVTVRRKGDVIRLASAATR